MVKLKDEGSKWKICKEYKNFEENVYYSPWIL